MACGPIRPTSGWTSGAACRSARLGAAGAWFERLSALRRVVRPLSSLNIGMVYFTEGLAIGTLGGRA